MTRDAIDERIIRVLRNDGRISNAKLAETIGLSQSACHRRLQQLESSGVIRGYTALLDDRTDDDGSVVIVQISLERQTEDFLRRFEAAIRKCAEVRECHLMTGQHDYVVLVAARGTADYERIHTEVLSRLPGVSRIQSSFAIRTVIRSRR